MSPLGGHFQPGDHAQHGGLAAAAGPEQRHQLAFLDGEIDVVDRGDFAEILGHVFQFDAHARSEYRISNMKLQMFNVFDRPLRQIVVPVASAIRPEF